MEKPAIYTVGHSTHPIEYFVQLLKHFQVNCIVDVRSLAASRFNPQYNKKALADSLGRVGITYLHFGEEFGARQTDPALLDAEGRVDFEKMRQSQKFKAGIQRLKEGVQQRFTIALMCSEADPLQCHRFAMISLALNDFEVKHIMKDMSFTGQHELEGQLLKMYAKSLKQLNIFDDDSSDPENLSIAFQMLNKEVAYTPGDKKGVV